MPDLEVTYEIQTQADAVEGFARDVLLEQTFETPQEVVDRYPDLAELGRGRVQSIQEIDDGRYHVRLAIPDHNALDAGQVLNVIFGNAAIHRGIRLIDFDPTPNLIERLPGPVNGVAGVRERLQVPTRPLTATALKPVGLPLSEITKLCRELADSGIDVIKDDHYLSDQPACPFEERIRACADIAAAASDRQGRPIWYVPSISGTPSEVERRIALAREAGIECIMLAPMALGLPVLAEVAANNSDMVILAHPSFSPMTAFTPEALWGKLFRMFGADAVIFVNAGGRFDYSEERCRLVAATMMAPLHGCRPSLPVPAGGVGVEQVERVIRSYGNDCMLLVGGSILRASDRRSAAERFVASVEEHALLTN